MLEAVVAFGAVGLFLALCSSIHVSAMLRIGAISGSRASSSGSR